VDTAVKEGPQIPSSANWSRRAAGASCDYRRCRKPHARLSMALLQPLQLASRTFKQSTNNTEAHTMTTADLLLTCQALKSNISQKARLRIRSHHMGPGPFMTVLMRLSANTEAAGGSQAGQNTVTWRRRSHARTTAKTAPRRLDWGKGVSSARRPSVLDQTHANMNICTQAPSPSCCRGDCKLSGGAQAPAGRTSWDCARQAVACSHAPPVPSTGRLKQDGRPGPAWIQSVRGPAWST